MNVGAPAGNSASHYNSATATSGSCSNSSRGVSGPAGVVTISHTEMMHLRCRISTARPCNSFHGIIKGGVGAASLATHFRNSAIDSGAATAIVNQDRSGARQHIVRVEVIDGEVVRGDGVGVIAGGLDGEGGAVGLAELVARGEFAGCRSTGGGTRSSKGGGRWT